MSNNSLQLGSKGADVAKLKQILQNKGFLPSPDYFDELTQKAVQNFQKTFGLPADGIVKEDTWKVLEGTKDCISGINVSQYQGEIDWSEVAKTEVKFAFAQLNNGILHLDSQFQKNWEGIKEAGLIRGVYQFLRANESIEAQLDILFKYVPKLEQGDLPPMLYIESDVNKGINVGTSLTPSVDAWLKAVKAHYSNCTPIIYTSAYVWDSQVSLDTTSYSQYMLWVVNYQVKNPQLPTSWKDWHFWQYDTQSVSGIHGEVEANYFKGSEKDLRDLASLPNA